ncbi:MAG: hypothetical protein IT485_11620 [Gammaproteobacteria bacterium]|nr:hypothetical protein [Gammaproteobacteria bacterium]CAG0928158.1 hypothetical protein RHDC3_00672 [Rhodocyclaceae bacterium]
MHAIRLAIIFLLASWSFGAHAADLALQNQDCAKVLESWAENPKSVPKGLVDACKEQLAQAAPVAAVAAAPAPAAIDPCAQGGAAGNVLCWGPWAALAPAAAAPLASLAIPEERGDCDVGSGLAEQCRVQLAAAEPPAEYLVEPCTAGAPCGFATFVSGVTSTGDVEDTSFKRFDMDSDGTRFTVDPDGPDQVDSVTMGTNVQPRPDEWSNLRSSGTAGSEQSRLVARILGDEESGIELAADIWAHGNRETRTGHSGYFAWGTATSASGLSLLNGNGISLTFTGPMSVNNATNASVTVNFGSQANWTGTWTNPAWSFGAGGSVSGPNLLSSPAQFTSNVQSGSVVQGALLGEPGRQQGLAHIIDVRLTDGGHIKDVGLLRPTGPVPDAAGAISP